MTYSRVCNWLGWQYDIPVGEACRYLESKGKRFLSDFGSLNAIDMALDLMEREMTGTAKEEIH